MAVVLDTAHCSASLSHLIKSAEKEIILVSPYLQISPILLNLLRDASSRNVEIILVYRDDKPAGKSSERLNEEKSKLDGINVKMLKLENLHAKCYLNESMAVLTSMNLYQHSQENNTELGLMVIDRQNPEDPDSVLYNNIREEVLTICRFAQQSQLLSANSTSVSKPKNQTVPKSSSSPSKSAASKKSSSSGGLIETVMDVIFGTPKCYCIRCSAEIEDDINKPLCSKCYSSWARYQNDKFPEKYCFGCGKPAETTYLRPLCDDCYYNQ
ncbi:MAG: phospholipase D family protein [Methanosarcinales archaeon]|jgi:hypothetical protein|nr:phospholipase D family protein [Methanosarcinales archaeon]